MAAALIQRGQGRGGEEEQRPRREVERVCPAPCTPREVNKEGDAHSRLPALVFFLFLGVVWRALVSTAATLDGLAARACAGRQQTGKALGSGVAGLLGSRCDDSLSLFNCATSVTPARLLSRCLMSAMSFVGTCPCALWGRR